LVSNLSAAGLSCLLASGEESREQVASRAARLGLRGDDVKFIPGRDLAEVTGAAVAEKPFLLAVDSIQTLRDSENTAVTGGPTQVRACADALVGLAKQEQICVLMTGHVTKDGDLAGPRTLEHAVDVVLAFDGDPRNGLRMVSGGKNRFGQEGEIAWFEMQTDGLHEIDPGDHLAPGDDRAGSVTALPVAGRRALAVEVQALTVPTESGARRQVAGLDPRRFQLIAAVVERVAGVPLSRSDLYGASAGGVRIDDPGCDLAIAAALASAASGRPAPSGSAFVGEISLTGQVRPVAGMAQRAAAAKARKLGVVFGPKAAAVPKGMKTVAVSDVREALDWAIS
jgi:DNA repair protein RadA/Sms